jgi:thioredoxin reductase (NADPH)
MIDYDVAIIGCGPAGLGAGIYTGRAGLKTVVIGLPEKSQAQMAHGIENYFGFPEGVDGGVLVSKGIIHCTKFGVKFIKEEVVSAQQDGKTFHIKTSGGQEVKCKSMVIATGTPIKLSGILNEESLTGKGVHYCVSCDGPIYKTKKFAVVGNGNHAAEDAIEALSYTKDITIIANSNKFEFSDAYDKEITKWKIKTVLGDVKEFKAGKFLEGVIMSDGTEMKFDCVFMACGTAGALDFAANLGLQIEKNVLVVDENNMTSTEGIFAAGNCTGRCRQIAKNVGDGCNAGVSVIRYLRSKDVYMDYAHNNAGITVTKNEVKIEPVKEKKEAVSESIVPDEKNIIKNVKPAEVRATIPIPPKKKIRIGWFSFSCCEDSTIVFTEILNDYWDKWKGIIEVAHARVLKSKNDMSNLDIAFVEGAISNPKQEEEVKKIRENSKKVIAIGSCAVTGMPSGQRNEFDEERKREIAPIVEMFKYNPNVKKLSDVIKVDDSVPGCPMSEAGFIAAVDKYAKEFGLGA